MVRVALVCVVLLVWGCSEAITPNPMNIDRDGSVEPDGRVSPPPTPPPEMDAEVPIMSDAGMEPPPTVRLPPSSYLCDMSPPPGSPTPPPPPTYRGGTCPSLSPGMNRIRSGGAEREFILLYPEDVSDADRLPVVFFWHWLGGSAGSFVRRGELEAAVEEQRFIAVIPEDKGDTLFRWPFSQLDSEARLQEELGFFDDLLACVHESFPVNDQCVVSAGVSAGALWTSQLAVHRSQYLSSMISLSGGTGEGTIRPWRTAEHRLPSLVLWGGPSDICIVINFQDLSNDLSANLDRDGHFLVECVHNCGHSVPPVEPAEGMSIFAPFWEFGFNHPYWLRDGESPYLADGLPGHFPSWCSIGRGTARPRAGVCTDDSGC